MPNHVAANLHATILSHFSAATCPANGPLHCPCEARRQIVRVGPSADTMVADGSVLSPTQ
eukprot:10346279-Prorocentrum_lima.AAC.1